MKTVQCSIDECKMIFLRLSVYYKSALIGGVILLGLILGLWTWSYAQYKDDTKIIGSRIERLESFVNDVQFLRQSSDRILVNQNQILIDQRLILQKLQVVEDKNEFK
jgi:hypothetical protein